MRRSRSQGHSTGQKKRSRAVSTGKKSLPKFNTGFWTWSKIVLGYYQKRQPLSKLSFVRAVGLEPTRLTTQDPKSCLATITTRPQRGDKIIRFSAFFQKEERGLWLILLIQGCLCLAFLLTHGFLLLPGGLAGSDSLLPPGCLGATGSICP